MRLLITAIVAFALAGCPAKQAEQSQGDALVTTDVQVADASVADAQVEPVACVWEEAVSGRFYMQPKNSWLKSGLKDVWHDEAHWWVEAQVVEDGCVADAPSTDTLEALKSIRSEVLDELVRLGLLPSEDAYWATKRVGKIDVNIFPRELYLQSVWDNMVKKNITKRLDGKPLISGLRLRVEHRLLKAKANLDWWDEHDADLEVGKANE